MDIKKRNENRKEKLAEYMFGMSKLTFATMVIGGLTPIISSDAPQGINWLVLIGGAVATYTFAFFGNRILK